MVEEVANGLHSISGGQLRSDEAVQAQKIKKDLY
jgi:hypothetical protein